jgi:hypothetical protein
VNRGSKREPSSSYKLPDAFCVDSDGVGGIEKILAIDARNGSAGGVWQDANIAQPCEDPCGSDSAQSAKNDKLAQAMLIPQRLSMKVIHNGLGT